VIHPPVLPLPGALTRALSCTALIILSFHQHHWKPSTLPTTQKALSHWQEQILTV